MYSNDAEFLSFVASSDMRSHQNHIVNLTSTAMKVDVAAAKAGFGVLANAPNAGENAQVAVEGVQLVRAGAAVAYADLVTAAATGWALPLVSGAAGTVMGRALAACASGSVFPLFINVYDVTSL